ncbi:MAG: hypothetical protein ACOH5I_05615 [Oligoflexus sp.]
MKRVFEFVPAEHEAMVSRILVTTHQAIDEAFPDAKPAPHRFAKTVFGDEPTVNQMMPHDPQSQHHMSEDALREVSDRLSSSKPYIFSDESPLTAKNRHNGISDTNGGNSIFGLHQKRRIQTLVGCVILAVGLILAYLFW